ncbi:MAG: PepSY domain-containing protein [Opitutaceae bacterium]
MSLQLPRKRTILAWHRWMGFASALFLLVLSVTGLLLNHTERLGLDDITIRNSMILDRYGMAAGNEITAYRIHESNTIAHLDGQLFYNGEPLIQASAPIDIIKDGITTVVATADALIYFTPDGQLIEKVSNSQLPYATLSAVGITARGKAVLVAESGAWTADENWLEFQKYDGGYNVIPMLQIELDDEAAQKILDNFQGGGVSLYRVLLDLHSGRLFGWGGRTLMDLSAVAIILLITSGIGGWLRKSRRSTAQPTN